MKIRLTFCRNAFAAAALATVLVVANTSAQEVRATITGIVQDSSGAPIAGAQIVVTSAQTNASIETTSNASGNYVTPFLQPGGYRMTVTFPGFRQHVRSNITLATQDRARIDVQLELGEVTESVTVTDSVSLVESETASRSQVIANKLIEDVPTQGRNPFQLAWSAAGVIKSGDWRYLRSFDTGGTSNFSVNGGRNKENEMLIDGISDVQGNRNVVHVPMMETVQEFKVITNSYDAQYGRTGGGTVSIVTKGGGNDFHGTLFEYFQAEELNANQFELNLGGAKKPPMTVNTYGFFASGPVFIPKLYDGRNRLFWTLSYEGMRQRSADPGVANFPLDEWRTGDFSTLLNQSGAQVGVYDPLTTDAAGNRQQFANNRIPTNRINPIASKALSFMPSPNSPGDPFTRANNYIYPSQWVANLDQWSGRMDYVVNDNNRVFFRYAQNPFSEFRSLVWGGSNAAEPSGNAPLLRNGRTWAADWTSTLSPTMTFVLRAGLSRWETSSGNVYGAGYDPALLGFDSALTSQLTQFQFPRFNLGTYQAIGSDRLWSSSPGDTYSLQPSFNWVSGAHFFKFGSEFRRYNANSNNAGSASGNYTFQKRWTQANAITPSATSGNELATFLLGIPEGFVDRNIAPAYRNHYYSFFFNDDWKVSSRMTLNLGLRWDYESPIKERYDRQLRGFDVSAANPLDSQVAGIDLRGIVEFAGVNGNPSEAFAKDKNNFQPRIGVAYRLSDKLAIRGGYGLFYLGQSATGAAQGFSQRTNIVPSVDGNLTPAISLANPFANYPGGQLLSAVGNSEGDASFIGQNLTVNYIERPQAYSQQFSFDIQYELPGNMLAEIGYTGNMTDSLPVTVTNMNVLPGSEMDRRTATGAIDTAYYTAKVANPMAGLIPANASLNGSTIARELLLRPFPQYGTIRMDNVPIGKQRYHGMQLKVTKRYSNGVAFVANYGVGKTLEQVSFRNDQDFNLNNPESSDLEKRSAENIDVPQKFVLAGSWELPFGRGRKFGNNWNSVSNFVLGGWSLNANGTIQKGWAVAYPNAAQLVSGSAAVSEQTLNQAFDTSLWRDSSGKFVSALSKYELKRFPTRFGDVRIPGYQNLDASIAKNFSITEGIRAQFRFEAINALNSPWFARIQSVDVTNAQFGQLNATQRNLPRWLKLGLVLNW